MVAAVCLDDETQLLAEQEHPGDPVCGCYGQALQTHRAKQQLWLPDAKPPSVYTMWYNTERGGMMRQMWSARFQQGRKGRLLYGRTFLLLS